jgi:hypothetical protein
LFATGLVAGGTLTGVFSALLKAIPAGDSDVLTLCQKVGEGFQEHLGKAFSLDLFGLIMWTILGFFLVKVALRKTEVSGMAKS